jgi:hypothetical protein
MEEQDKAQVPEAVGEAARTSHRHPVQNDALLTVIGETDEIGQSLIIQHCSVLDLSLGGCRLRAKEPFAAQAKLPVEVTFRIRGLPMLLRGTIQWTDGRDTFGIRFVDVSSRRKAALNEVLSEMEAMHASEERVPENVAVAHRKCVIRSSPTQADGGVTQPAAEVLEADQPTPKSPFVDRRAHPRQLVVTSAVIFLVNIGSRLSGELLELNPNGCRIRTDETSDVNIYARADTELLVDGQPFRIRGVIEDNQDQCFLRVRFIDINLIQRQKIGQLIDEIQEGAESSD